MRSAGSPAVLEYRRSLAVQRVAEGYSTEEAADFLGVDPSSVRRWLAAYRRDGGDGLTAQPVPGRLPKLTTTQEKIVLRWLSDPPTEYGFATDLWSGPRLAQLIEQEFDAHFHPYLNSAPLPFPPGTRRVAVEPDVQRRGSDGVHQGVRPGVRAPLRPRGVAATPRPSRATPPGERTPSPGERTPSPGERTPPTRTRRGPRRPRPGSTPVQTPGRTLLQGASQATAQDARPQIRQGPRAPRPPLAPLSRGCR